MKTGELRKLFIEAYDRIEFDHDSSISKVGTFEVMFNPEKYSRKYQVEYEENQSKGSTADSQKFKGIKEQEFTLDFVIDGTGVATAAPGEVVKEVNVEDEIQKLVSLTTLIEPDAHRNRFLKIYWGNFILRCVLSSLDINYTLFHPDGTALRAKVNMKVKEVKSDERRVSDDRKQSPDLTQVRVMRRGDRLDYMAFQKYRDPAYYLQLAKVNELDNFRRPQIGRSLRFPPLSNNPKATNKPKA